MNKFIHSVGGTTLLLAAAFSFAQVQPSAVVVATVEEASLTPTQPIAGTVFSRHDVQITAGVDGQLTFVAEPGTVVTTGDVIASLDVVPLQLQRAEQKAQLERARAQVRYLSSQVSRQRDLPSIAANAREQTVSDRDVAASDVKIAELRIAQIDQQLERASIKAPFTGVMVARERREGEDIARGTVLGRLVDLSRIEVRVMVPLRFYGRVATGDSLTLYGFEKERSGVVRSMIPAVDARAQAFELRIDPVEDGGQSLTIGELVSVAVPMRSASESLVVPRDALILRRDGAFVFRVNDDQTATRIAVTTGDSRGDVVAVSGELLAGDQVVIRGAESLRDGATINVVSAGSGTQSLARPAS
ncbi:MAG: efflux RND transporter periplasmic adaptor subunit [Gammaproteobacteria bacterium]